MSDRQLEKMIVAEAVSYTVTGGLLRTILVHRFFNPRIQSA